MEELNVKELINILWRKKIFIIIGIIFFTILGCVYSYNFVKPMYKSTSTIILGKIISSNTNILETEQTKYQQSTEMISESDLSLNSSLIETYSELVKSKTLIEKVKNKLNINIETEDFMKNISVSRVNNSDLLEITVINENNEKAQKIVKEVVRIFSDKVKEIYNISNVYVIDEASLLDEPYNVNHVKDIIIFTIVGIVVSITFVLICDSLDNTIKNSEDIENVVKLKTLITIPLHKKSKEELITVKESKSVISEAFRTLRTNVQFSNINSKENKTLLITSCLPEEGKSYVSANLAITFAQVGKKVIIVDSDMRRGRQAQIFNVPNANGLSNYISNIDSNGIELNWSLGKYIKETSISNLNIITAGNVPPNPSELLASERLIELIEELKKYYEIIIFDGAPVLPITDSLLLARTLGNTMLVASYNQTKKENLIKATNSIKNVGGKIIGVCLNKVSDKSIQYKDNYYYYAQPEDNKKSFKNLKSLFNYKNKINNIIKKIKTLHKRLDDKTIKNENKQDLQINQKKEEEQKIKQAEQIIKEENKKRKKEEKQIKYQEFLEKIQSNKKELKNKIDKYKEKYKERRDKFWEKLAVKYEENKAKQEEKDKFKKEQKEIRDQENTKLKEEKRIKKEERKKELDAERERIQLEITKKREQEKIKKEAEKLKNAEEKAKKEAEFAEAKAKKEAENLRVREEVKERKAKEKEEAKFTDEYLEENLYPKTKYNKF